MDNLRHCTWRKTQEQVKWKNGYNWKEKDLISFSCQFLFLEILSNIKGMFGYLEFFFFFFFTFFFLYFLSFQFYIENFKNQTVPETLIKKKQFHLTFFTYASFLVFMKQRVVSNLLTRNEKGKSWPPNQSLREVELR